MSVPWHSEEDSWSNLLQGINQSTLGDEDMAHHECTAKWGQKTTYLEGIWPCKVHSECIVKSHVHIRQLQGETDHMIT